NHPPAPVGQQGPPARDAASAARARRVARGSLLLTTGTASRRARRTRSFRAMLRALDPDRKTRTTASRPAAMPPRGRLQIDTMAGFNLECVAGFVGIRNVRPNGQMERVRHAQCREDDDAPGADLSRPAETPRPRAR